MRSASKAIRNLLLGVLGFGALGTIALEGPSFAQPVAFQQQDLGFAPTGLVADLEVAHCLASLAHFEAAVDLLEKALVAADPGESARGQRGLVRIQGLLQLRDEHLASLAESGGKLRIDIDGKRRSLRVSGFADGTVNFDQNKYNLDSVRASELSISELAQAWKNAKAGAVEVRALGLRLAGEKSWKTLWSRHEEGHEQFLEDMQDLPASIARGQVTLDMRTLEGYLGRPLDAAGAQDVLTRHARLFGKDKPAKFDKQDPQAKQKYKRVKSLVHDALLASWDLQALGESLHATQFEVIGEQLRLVYNFDSEDELMDWLPDETRIGDMTSYGSPTIPETDWKMEVKDGFLQCLGLGKLAHILPFRGPLKLRYPLQITKMHKEDALFICGAFLNDNQQKSYLSVLGFGNFLRGYENGRVKRADRKLEFWFVATNYFINIEYAKDGLLTVFREDKPDVTKLTLKTRRVDNGYIGIAANTDYPTVVDSFEILGTPDERRMDIFRDEWVSLHMETMGY